MVGVSSSGSNFWFRGWISLEWYSNIIWGEGISCGDNNVKW